MRHKEGHQTGKGKGSKFGYFKRLKLHWGWCHYTSPRKTKEGFCGVREGEEEMKEEEREFPARARTKRMTAET